MSLPYVSMYVQYTTIEFPYVPSQKSCSKTPPLPLFPKPPFPPLKQKKKIYISSDKTKRGGGVLFLFYSYFVEMSGEMIIYIFIWIFRFVSAPPPAKSILLVFIREKKERKKKVGRGERLQEK